MDAETNPNNDILWKQQIAATSSHDNWDFVILTPFLTLSLPEGDRRLAKNAVSRPLYWQME